jgi:predicted DNA-binding transcriptional regulator AlpA
MEQFSISMSTLYVFAIGATIPSQIRMGGSFLSMFF